MTLDRTDLHNNGMSRKYEYPKLLKNQFFIGPRKCFDIIFTQSARPQNESAEYVSHAEGLPGPPEFNSGV
jgi:hypothetical protein